MAETFGSDFLVMEQLLAQGDIDMTAAEADGRLMSLGAMLGGDAIAAWLQQLVSDNGHSNIEPVLSQLAAIAERRLNVMDSAEALPVLCLPDDDDDMRDRVDSLVLWATGFLGGLGEGAAMRGSPARQRLEDEPLAELLVDLTQITKAEITADELASDPDSAEAAYAELVEFLRVAAQLSYEELEPVRSIGQPEQMLVH